MYIASKEAVCCQQKPVDRVHGQNVHQRNVVVVQLEVIYGFQATNRREGGDTSCPGLGREAPGLHLKEVETVQAVPELLGMLTIGGGSARPWGGSGEDIYTFTAVRNSQKRRKNGWFRACFGL
jgi:hypothetical protein